MKKLLLYAIFAGCSIRAIEVTPTENREELVMDQARALTVQFRDTLLAQVPDLAVVYQTLNDEQKIEFDKLCEDFVTLNQQAFQVLNPAYTNLFTAMQALTGFVDWKIVLMFSGNQLTQPLESLSNE